MTFALYQYFQLLSLILAIACYKGLRQYSLTAFIPLLVLTNIVEPLGMNYERFGWPDSYFLYNIYILLSMPLYLYIFSKLLFLKNRETSIYIIITVLAMLAILLNYFFAQGITTFNNYSGILLQILNIFFSCLALFRLSFHPDRPTHLFKDPYFWISAVTFIFGLAALVLLGLQPFIQSNRIKIDDKSLYHAILPIANVILYSGYSYAFILCRIQAPSSSPLLQSS